MKKIIAVVMFILSAAGLLLSATATGAPAPLMPASVPAELQPLFHYLASSGGYSYSDLMGSMIQSTTLDQARWSDYAPYLTPQGITSWEALLRILHNYGFHAGSWDNGFLDWLNGRVPDSIRWHRHDNVSRNWSDMEELNRYRETGSKDGDESREPTDSDNRAADNVRQFSLDPAWLLALLPIAVLLLLGLRGQAAALPA